VSKCLLPPAAVVVFVGLTAAADQGAGQQDKVQRVPPAGKAVPDDVRKELQAGTDELARSIDDLRTALKAKPALLDLLPDVQVYHKAVDWALRYDEFFDAREFATARRILQQGQERARQLRDGQTPWTTATGLVIRGYVSRIDGSVQPYGLVVPDTYRPPTAHKFRLDLWWHGRDERLTELKFVNDRQTNRGQFSPPNAFVLHPYGRYCNANKFAGEVDTFEAMEHVKAHYPIDEDHIVARGFSMGGAACWQFATHFPDVWCAAAPGAGFAESAEFLNIARERVQPPDYEKKLWRLYDSTDYALNLFNLPTVAYSGEIDRQKQAADIMAKMLNAERMDLTHLIGPQTGHAYQPETKKEIDRLIDTLAAKGRDALPRVVKFTTPTLRYNRSFWVRVDALERHWDNARIEAEIDGNRVIVRSTGVAALTLVMAPGQCPLDPTQQGDVRTGPVHQRIAVYFAPFGAAITDGRYGIVARSKPKTDRSWVSRWKKTADGWTEIVAGTDDTGLTKRHGLQGPIDDAFMDRFLMVRPTGTPLNDRVGAWADGEMRHAVEHWRRQFRGDAPVKDDTAVTDADIASSNLVLWGDPSSNKMLARIADKLPVKWTTEGVRVGAQTFGADKHVPVLIYPNPLNPAKYVVLNSGFTFREFDYLNNARQTPKLPDYAVLDVSAPPTPRAPAQVVLADFFDEQWELPPLK
jgi:pimeloyl-ACP methyl ester carboxylesterase